MRELGLADVRVVRSRRHRPARRRGPREGRRRPACTRASRSRGFVVDAPTLEDIFVSLTGEGFDVSG